MYRGTHYQQLLEVFRQRNAIPDVLFLSEMDYGMVRSGNEYIVKRIAEKLHYKYIFASEFFEFTKGTKKERKIKGENQESMHGNALLSRFSIKNYELQDLYGDFVWLEDFEKREGSRNAIIADLDIGNGDTLTVCSTHLERLTSRHTRRRQFQEIVNTLEQRNKGQPIVIGGDMNTTAYNNGHFYFNILKAFPNSYKRIKNPIPDEPLFEVANEYGYDYSYDNKEWATWKNIDSKVLRFVKANLDWIFIKNIDKTKVGFRRVDKLDGKASLISDHLPVYREIEI